MELKQQIQQIILHLLRTATKFLFYFILLLVDVVVSTCVNGIFLHFHLEIILRYKYNIFKLLFVYG